MSWAADPRRLGQAHHTHTEIEAMIPKRLAPRRVFINLLEHLFHFR